MIRRLAIAALLLAAIPAAAQDHPCEADAAQTRGPEKAYRKECCEQRPYRALAEVARGEGIEIRARRTAQQPVPGYYLCVVEFACVASVKKIQAERNRSAPDLFYTPHDLTCGPDRDKYLCAIGNAWACK